MRARPAIFAIILAAAGVLHPAPAVAQTLPGYASAASPEEKLGLTRQLYAVYAYATTFSQGGAVTSADEAIRAVERRIASDGARIRQLENTRRRNSAELEAANLSIRQARLELTQLKEDAVNASMAADASLAAMEATLREQVETASPEELAALQRFADGDRVGANEILDLIAEAQRRGRARAEQARAEHFHRTEAQGWRSQAQRHDLMLGLGEGGLTAAAVLPEWENVVLHAPGDADAWFRIGGLRYDLGDVGGAEAAYEKAIEFAATPLMRQRALGILIVNESSRRSAGLTTTRDRELAIRYLAAMGISDPDIGAEPVRETGSPGEQMLRMGQAHLAGFDTAAITDPEMWSGPINSHVIMAWGAYQQRDWDRSNAEIAIARDLLLAHGPGLRRPDALRLTAQVAALENELALTSGDTLKALRAARAFFASAEELVRLDPTNVRSLELLSRSLAGLGEAHIQAEDYGRAVEAFVKVSDDYFVVWTRDLSSVTAIGSWREMLQRVLVACRLGELVEPCDTFFASLPGKLDTIPLRSPADERRVAMARGIAMLAKAHLLSDRWSGDQLSRHLQDLDALAAPYLGPDNPDRHAFTTLMIGSEMLRAMAARGRGEAATAASHFKDALTLSLAQLEASRGLVPLSEATIYRDVVWLRLAIAEVDPTPQNRLDAALWLSEAVRAGIIHRDDMRPDFLAEMQALAAAVQATPELTPPEPTAVVQD